MKFKKTIAWKYESGDKKELVKTKIKTWFLNICELKAESETNTGFLILDKTCVMGIEPLTDEFKELLKGFKRTKVPDLKNTKYGETRIGSDYVREAFKLLNITAKYDEEYKFISDFESPMTIQNQFFKVIIAPRVD